MNRMNIDHLKIFCLVVEEGSISQAARLSYVSQPAVSRQIHQLENFYGTLLFNRIDGKLTLTKMGKMLYPYAKTIVKDFNHSLEIIQQATGDRNLYLRVGASLTVGEYLLPDLLGRFKKMFPEIKLTLTIANTPHILEDLSNDTIDLALVEGIVENKELIFEKFANDELILVYPNDHPWSGMEEIGLEQLSSERIIWREPTSSTRLIIENTLKHYGALDKIENYMELGSTQAIKSAVEAGLGISILPRLTVQRELEYGLLREIKIRGLDLNRNLWMVQKPQRFKRNSVNKFTDFIYDVNKVDTVF